MKILIAEHSGICFGVKKALEIAEKFADTKSDTYTLGPLIHNKQVVEKLDKKGLKVVDNLDQIDEGTVIIRSHGVPPEVHGEAAKKIIELVDATCPFVKKIQEKVKEYYEKGYQIIIVGDANHPEVKGVNGWCNYSAVIVDSEEKAAKIGYYDRLCVVAQTTITQKTWEDIKRILEKKGGEAEFFNTICNATYLRQQAAVELAERVELMLVIGGLHSSNTQKLYKLCAEKCNNTYHIETSDDLPVDKINEVEIIGVTAGASTPDWIIKEVVDKMTEMENNKTESNEIEGVVVEENVQPEEKVQEPAQERTMENLEDTMVSIKPGKVVKGKVLQVGKEDVIVNIGYKSDGIIPRDELSSDGSLSPAEVLSEGDEIEVFVKKIDEKEGHVVLSKKKVDLEKAWKTIKQKYDENEAVNAKVVEEVKGGLIAVVEGIRGFIPASHVDIGYVENLKEFIGRELSVRVIEFNRSKGKVILSRKTLLEAEREAKKKQLLESLKEGDRIKGEVKRLTDFGAFVDIGGIDGLVHISEMSWNRVGHPSEVMNIGDEVEVVVLGVEEENERISLGYKQTKPHPWDKITERYSQGEVVEGRIVRLVDFGAFVELEPGIEGLVHISQISYEHVEKPRDVLQEGQSVKVKILDIRPEERRISLSIKEATEKPKREEKKEKVQPAAAHSDNEPPITIGDLVGDILKDNKE
ncbi:MAG: SSU ribosomal protein S1p [Firmicutes bacterium]|nr:SSU ribosomal protein S1p [Bacillota bacterium]MDI6706381.1 bifunctional 4-hydroxy-3-methylbut-2-enyl diphosphate reductase/30S ribosomal protein S1 [Bacillota bacterium]